MVLKCACCRVLCILDALSNLRHHSLLTKTVECRTTLCRFSGLRIYPGRGVQFVQKDGTKAANLAWTATYRKLHKKDQAGEATKRKRRNLHSKKPRAIVGASMEEIQKKRSERPDVRQKARELAVREIKDRMKKSKAAKASAAKPSGPKPTYSKSSAKPTQAGKR